MIRASSAWCWSWQNEPDTSEDVRKAKELIDKLAEYKPLAKVEERGEQNYNMINNVLNNLPQDPEEKKEPAPQKEMRISEHKKVRKSSHAFPSLKESHKLYVFLVILNGVSVIKLLKILMFIKGCQFFFILAVKVNNATSDLTLDIYQNICDKFH